MYKVKKKFISSFFLFSFLKIVPIVLLPQGSRLHRPFSNIGREFSLSRPSKFTRNSVPDKINPCVIAVLNNLLIRIVKLMYESHYPRPYDTTLSWKHNNRIIFIFLRYFTESKQKKM